MPMLLVADDSEIDRMVIIELLKKEPLHALVEAVTSDVKSRSKPRTRC